MKQLLLVSLGLLALLGPAAAAEPRRPNFVFIISDDQRSDALGVAGNAAIRTPVLDRLAAEGVWFRQGTIHIPQCSPTRCTLLTGLPPHQHRWYSNQYQHPDVNNGNGFKGLPTLPGKLRDAGYRTVLVGKWHPTPEPWNCGFTDVRVWMPGGGGLYKQPRLAFGDTQKLQPIEAAVAGAAAAVWKAHGSSRATQPVPGFTQEIFTDDALAFLQSDEATAKPFFLWLAYTAPHAPHEPNPEHIQKLYADKNHEELLPPGFPTDAKPAPWRIYYEATSFLDEQVGRVLAALHDRKLEDNTVVVFVGDNGYMMGDRNWSGKVIPYEGSVRVPFLVRGPGVALHGTSDAPVSSLDLPPTFLKLASLEPPQQWPGRDLTPLLAGRKDHGITEAICEWADDQSEMFGSLTYRLVRTPTHKLIVWEKKPAELYNLTADPNERKNLIDEPSAAAVRDDLSKRLAAWMDKTNDPARQWHEVKEK